MGRDFCQELWEVSSAKNKLPLSLPLFYKGQGGSNSCIHIEELDS